MKKFWKKLKQSLKKLLIRQKTKQTNKPVQLGQIIRTGHAILVKDKLSSAQVWHTFGRDDEVGILLNPNEPLILRTNCFQRGTRVDIYERAGSK